MASYAKVEDGLVTQVIVAEPEFFERFVDSSPGRWIETTPDAFGGNHPKGKAMAIRKNYAGVGYSYDHRLDAFIPPKTAASWVLNEETCLWEAPVPMPSSGSYEWDEETVSWKESSDG